MNSNAQPSRSAGWLTSDGSYPLHPFFFALASVLALMASSLNQATFFHAAPTMAGAIVFAALVFLAVGALRRRLDARTTVIASIWVAGSVFYLSLFGSINTTLGGGYPMVRSLPVALTILIILTAIVLYLPVLLINIGNIVLNVMAVILCATPAWQAISYEWQNGASRVIYSPDQAADEMSEIAQVDQYGSDGRPPDIYHFVFDRYTSQQVLDEYFDFDNSETIAFLEDRGFYVADDSFSNYHRTAFSLGSSFYMDYLTLFEDQPDLAGNNWQPIHRMLGDHRVARFLKARGYDFFQFGSWWMGTFANPVADVNRPHGFSEFNMLYLRRTMLRPIFHALPDWPLAMRLDWDNAQCQRVAPQIEEIKDIGERDNPTYVFAHILVPHGPYNFAADGRCMSQAESAERGAAQGFLDQTAYVNLIIEDLVTRLQAQDREPPVIIITSDEGPFPADREGGVPWQEQSDDSLRIKTGIINAFYFPDGQYDELSDGITPVNIFRVVFNAIFGTQFELLPDRVFVSPNDGSLYEFHDVTERVRREGTAAPQ